MIYFCLPVPYGDGNPGDLDPSENRQIYGIMNFNEYVDYAPTIRTLVSPIQFYGNCGYFTAEDADSRKDDLTIVGPGRLLQPGTTMLSRRPLYSQLFKNLSFQDSDHKILLTTGCSNCSGDCQITQIQPDCEFGWVEFQMGGAFNDAANDHQQFVFPEWSDDGCHFHIVDYLPVTYEGDYDGVPNRSFTQNGVGSILMTTNTPAYSIPPYVKMGAPNTSNNKHMLTQPCGSVTYNFTASTLDDMPKGALSGQADRVVAAKAVTWKELNGTWLPFANYSWRMPMGSTGLPVNAYIPFNYSSPINSDISWRLIDSICKYTLNNLPKETARPLVGDSRSYSSTIYGHEGALTIGSVSNAQWEECGVYTCDYQSDMGYSGYLDYENGWEKGAGCDPSNPLPAPAVIMSDKGHFGNFSIYVVNAFGPSRNFRLTRGRDYEMSAWVNVEEGGTAWMHGDFRKIKKDDDDTWPITEGLIQETGVNFDGVSQSFTGGQWKLLRMNIPASKLLKEKDWNSFNWYARVFIGSVAGSGGHVYIDDIRFAPVDAMVSSTYYNSLLTTPIVTIDANNNPGKRVLL